MKKICCIFTTAPHYRSAIYKLIDGYYDCDWFFNDTKNDIKRLDYNMLSGSVKVQEIYKLPMGLTYQKGMLALLFKPYSSYFVFLYSNSVSTWLFLYLAKLFPNKKVYGWTHGWYGKETKIEAFIKKHIFKRADEIFTYGDYARDLMIKEGFRKDHIHTLHNSLDYEKQVALRNTNLTSEIYATKFGNKNPVLIFIGRLTFIKKLEQIVYSISKLKARGEIYNVVFVGDGPEKQKLEELSLKQNVLDQIWFYGACYDERKNAELIFNADLCVAPGNVGLAAMHAMVFGTPVISHDDFPYQMPEFEAIKPYKTGNFFKRNDVADLVERIDEWFRINGRNRDLVRENCYKEIDTQWNPFFQMNVIKKVIK